MTRSAGLPVRALLRGRRVRVLVGVTLVHAVALGVLSWSVGESLTVPSAAGLAVHVAVSLAAALPVWWQFAGDPVARQPAAARAMVFSFAGLAVYSAVDAVRDLTAPPLPGEPVLGAVLAMLVVAALAVLAHRERHDRADLAPGDPAVFAQSLVVALALVLLAAAASDLLAGTTVGGPAVTATVAVLAGREALRALQDAPAPPRETRAAR